MNLWEGGSSLELVINRVLKAMELTYDFYNFIPEHSLTMDIPNAPSNSIFQQVWCIVGARESYLKALEKGSWDGFSCSLQGSPDKGVVLDKLEESALNLKNFFTGTGSELINWNLVIDLLEHEIQHHGQLIRYSYANKLGFPNSWIKRYTVS